MAELNQREVNALIKAINTTQKRIKVRGVKGYLAAWKKPIELLDLDQYVSGQYLMLNLKLQQKIKADCPNWGINLDTNFKQMTPTEAATQGNDKAAGIKPEHNFVVVKALAGEIILQQQHLALPPEESLRCRFSSLKLDEYASILLIENLDSFDLIHAYSLPRLPQPCLVVFRGSPQHSPQGVTQLLNACTKQEVIAFTDADPAGLRIACTTNKVTAALFPTLTPSLINQASRSSKYQHDVLKQSEARQFLNAHPEQLGHWQNYWQQLSLVPASILQQLILSTNCCLTLHHK